MTEITIVNKSLANKMFDLGFELVEQAREVDGNLCFVFKVNSGQTALLKKLMSGSI